MILLLLLTLLTPLSLADHSLAARANVQKADVQTSATGIDACVILLHGLARTSHSMQKLADALEEEGFIAINTTYPSRKHTVETLADTVLPAAMAKCEALGVSAIHFVTHSLGGILVRQHLAHHPMQLPGRAVFLAPPNQGSEVVDTLKAIPGYSFFNGPAGNQLGTDPQSVPRSLGAVNFELGVIAGTRTFNPILSQMLPNPDDGKVSLYSTRVDGMCAFMTVPRTHTFIMKNDFVIEQVIHYLSMGSFSAENAEHPACEYRDNTRSARPVN
ncbi:MAG: esterase/lipase family protein [Granulosicoccus sp.]